MIERNMDDVWTPEHWPIVIAYLSYGSVELKNLQNKSQSNLSITNKVITILAQFNKLTLTINLDSQGHT